MTYFGQAYFGHDLLLATTFFWPRPSFGHALLWPPADFGHNLLLCRFGPILVARPKARPIWANLPSDETNLGHPPWLGLCVHSCKKPLK